MLSHRMTDSVKDVKKKSVNSNMKGSRNVRVAGFKTCLRTDQYSRKHW